MQIVIDIPEAVYKDAVNNRKFITLSRLEIVWGAIANGKSLPKGHGDLKDADAIMSTIKENLQIRPEFVIEHAPTIIKADKEIEDGPTND